MRNKDMLKIRKTKGSTLTYNRPDHGTRDLASYIKARRAAREAYSL
jgi:hypothetical protein